MSTIETPRTQQPRPATTPRGHPLVHAVQAGRLRANRTVWRGTGPTSLLRRWQTHEFPAIVYIIERPDGHIAIDTGVNASGYRYPFLFRRIAVSPIIEGEHEEIGPQMEARGLRPEDVRTVILTHLDLDHIGGLGWFPNAEVLVHRAEHAAAWGWTERLRYQPRRWPLDFHPTLYDLDPEPCGPFPESRALDADGDLRLVPIPGHSLGQVGVMLRSGDVMLFFVADHMFSQEWFVEDLAAGRLGGLLAAALWRKKYRKLAVETTRRIQRFAADNPTVLLPAHDPDAPRRLAARETLQL